MPRHGGGGASSCSTERNLTFKSSAAANPSSSTQSTLSDVGQARRPAVLQLLSRSPPRASRAGFLPKLPAAQAGKFAYFQKHAEIHPKQAEIVLKRAQKTRKTVDWLVTFASISQSRRPRAYVGKAHGIEFRISRMRARHPRRGPAPPRSTDFDRLPVNPAASKALQMLLGASCMSANCPAWHK